MLLHDPSYDGQAESHACTWMAVLRWFAGIQSHKGFEHAFSILSEDAWTVVLDLDGHETIPIRRSNDYTMARESTGVADQIS